MYLGLTPISGSYSLSLRYSSLGESITSGGRVVVEKLLGQMLSVDHKLYSKLIEENFSFIEHSREPI